MRHTLCFFSHLEAREAMGLTGLIEVLQTPSCGQGASLGAQLEPAGDAGSSGGQRDTDRKPKLASCSAKPRQLALQSNHTDMATLSRTFISRSRIFLSIFTRINIKLLFRVRR